MSSSIDEQLRESLHRNADALPYGSDLTGAAIARAGAIRRRRRSVAAVAAVAVLAVAIPLGMRLGDDVIRGEQAPAVDRSDTPTGPATVTLDLAALPTGDAPAIPWSEGSTYHDGGATLDLQSEPGRLYASQVGAYVSDEAVGGDGALVTWAGDSHRLYPATSRLERVLTSPQGRWTAIVAEDGDIQRDPKGEYTLHLFDADASNVVAQVPLGGEAPWLVEVADDGRVLLAPNHQPAIVVEPDGTQHTLTGLTEVSAWSPGNGLYGVTTVLKEGSGGCNAVVTAAREQLWESCDWTVTGVSPDATWVYAWSSSFGGYGQAVVALLDARAGAVVRQVEVPSTTDDPGMVMDAVFESDDSVLFQVEAGDRAALVRVDVLTGEAELATAPVGVRPVVYDFPYLLG